MADRSIKQDGQRVLPFGGHARWGPELRHRPIYGGVFGKGRYALATTPAVQHGLHAVRYMVIDPRAGTVLSIADGRRKAIATARAVIRASELLDERPAPERELQQVELWPRETTERRRARLQPRKTSRRRRAVFMRSGGRCHYCRATLHLDGPFHVEHQLPKALGGGDEPLNLVAACPRCNQRKGDKTAIEFASEGSPSARNDED